jgi:hypothetical protein
LIALWDSLQINDEIGWEKIIELDFLDERLHSIGNPKP